MISELIDNQTCQETFFSVSWEISEEKKITLLYVTAGLPAEAGGVFPQEGC